GPAHRPGGQAGDPAHEAGSGVVADVGEVEAGLGEGLAGLLAAGTGSTADLEAAELVVVDHDGDAGVARAGGGRCRARREDGYGQPCCRREGEGEDPGEASSYGTCAPLTRKV